MPQPVEDIPKAELWVAKEAAKEYRRNVHSALHSLREYYVGLDGLADGDLPHPPTLHMRDAQQNLRESIEYLKSERAMVTTRIGAIEERIEDVEAANQ